MIDALLTDDVLGPAILMLLAPLIVFPLIFALGLFVEVLFIAVGTGRHAVAHHRRKKARP